MSPSSTRRTPPSGWRPAASGTPLRIHRPPLRTEAAVEGELRWLEALRRDTDVLVPEPVRTGAGRLLTTATAEGVPESRICVLFRWVDGDFREVDDLTADDLHRVGVLTAALHDHATGFVSRNTDLCRPRIGLLTARAREEEAGGTTVQQACSDPRHGRDAGWAAEEVAAFSPRGAAAVRRVAEATRRIRDRLGTSPAVYGLVHADLHQENYLFGPDDVRLIDFDDCGFGHHLDDLAVTLSEITEHDDSAGLRAALLDGYRSARSLPTGAEADLEVLVAFRFAQILLWKVSLRDHPVFRDSWREDADDLIDELEASAIDSG
ncbi:phosphotransferase [Nakamurella sp. YIM 132087]|uniref:Phosphotransferase n=1 Tax=Nakamurella alba TaxID=2665158 RepID=A0A7K1FJW9_9ACTN|nr:phosphotransferase [Nakamurella alba]MTD14431.1 phosphotransferase [Nakamurella alba]